MRQSAYPFPRTIQPSLIEIGDTIKVSLPEDRGVVTTLTGTVGKRMDVGATRYFMTEEGATLVAWDAKENKKVTIILLHRPDATQKPLEMFDETMLRTG